MKITIKLYFDKPFNMTPQEAARFIREECMDGTEFGANMWKIGIWQHCTVVAKKDKLKDEV
jgi:hypothetical protein